MNNDKKIIFILKDTNYIIDQNFISSYIFFSINKNFLKVGVIRFVFNYFFQLDKSSYFLSYDGNYFEYNFSHFEKITGYLIDSKNYKYINEFYDIIFINKKYNINLTKNLNITDFICLLIYYINCQINDYDILILELDISVDNIETMPLIETINIFRNKFEGNIFFFYLFSISFIKGIKELKEKSFFKAINNFNNFGFFFDFVFIHSKYKINISFKEKISSLFNISCKNLINFFNVKNYYYNLLILEQTKFLINLFILLKINNVYLNQNNNYLKKNSFNIIRNPEFLIGYIYDSNIKLKYYNSVFDSLFFSSLLIGINFKLILINVSSFLLDNLLNLDGILYVEDLNYLFLEKDFFLFKIIKKRKIPFLSIGYSFSVLILESINSYLNNIFFIKNNISKIIIKELKNTCYSSYILSNTFIFNIYKSNIIYERYLDIYLINNKFLSNFFLNPYFISGIGNFKNFINIIEINIEIFFISLQFHPEFCSNLLTPHPIFNFFLSFIKNKEKL